MRIFFLLGIFLSSPSLALGPVPHPAFWAQEEIQHTKSKHPDETKRNFGHYNLDLGIALPLPVFNTVPVIDYQTKQMSRPDYPSLVSAKASIGFLHHAAEGSPRWYFELRRHGSSDTKGYVGALAAANLEHLPLPIGRLSDKPELWLWLSYRHFPKGDLWEPILDYQLTAANGFLFNARIPELLLIGMQSSKGTWAGVGGFESTVDWFASEDHNIWLRSRDLQWMIEGRYQPSADYFHLFLRTGILARQECAFNPDEKNCSSNRWIPYRPFMRLGFAFEPH